MSVLRKSKLNIRKKMSERQKEANGKITSCKSELLISQLAVASRKRQTVNEIIIDEQNVSLDKELLAFVKECRTSNDGGYIVVTMLIFESSEPIEKSFVYNRNTSSLKYLLQSAKKFISFRQSRNIVDLMGKAAVIIVSEKKGFLNMQIVKEISIEELDEHIANFDEATDNEAEEFNDEETDDMIDEEDYEEE